MFSRVESVPKKPATVACFCTRGSSPTAAIWLKKQIEAIRLIEEKGAFSRMPRSLREIAEKRMDNPDMPLKELGEAFDPPISKSAVNHRLRKLMEFAAQWQIEQDEEK